MDSFIVISGKGFGQGRLCWNADCVEQVPLSRFHEGSVRLNQVFQIFSVYIAEDLVQEVIWKLNEDAFGHGSKRLSVDSCG
jgi:hypothetical protein